MNKLKAGISFIAFLPSTLYVFCYYRLKNNYKPAKNAVWQPLHFNLEKTHWYIVFLHTNLYNGKEEASLSDLPCLVYKYLRMEGYYVKDCSL